jgi:carboxyl-terminal processing protease
MVKGTVQNVIDLNEFVRSSTVGDLGAIKTTTQNFINGGSTQLEVFAVMWLCQTVMVI